LILRFKPAHGMREGMKPTFMIALLVACLAFAGCESLSDAADSVRDRFSPRAEARTKTIAGSPRVVFDAVKLAAANMGYRQTAGGPAQGEFQGMSSVGAGDTAGSARQVGIRVHLHGTLDGASTEVSVRFTEILETDSSNRMGMATETTMKDTPLYEVFFRNVQQSLGVRPTAAPVAR
jgi:hypothetical protein